MSKRDQTFLITGAARGIGAATARACAGAGYRVILHASGDSDHARALGSALKDDLEHGAEIDFIFEDLARPGAGTRLVERACRLAGTPLDGIVNNAGIYEATPLTGPADAWDQGWSRTLAVNVQAPADIIRAAVGMRRAHGTDQPLRIVNIASRAGHRGDGVDHAGYAASKGAVLAMTKSWARALAAERVELYAIAPGWVETRMAPADIAAREKAIEEIPLGRVAQPEEVARVAAFLISGQCPSAVGSTIDINGASYVR